MIALAAPLRRPLVVTPKGYYGAPRPLRSGIHRGLDFQASAGDEVLAAAAGTVARVGFDPPPPQGNGGGIYVITRHDDEDGESYELGYMHLEQPALNKGDVVAPGDVLGYAGNTGTLNSGVHLHFQVKRVAPGAAMPIDPTSLLSLSSSRSASAKKSSPIGAIAIATALGWAIRRIFA